MTCAVPDQNVEITCIKVTQGWSWVRDKFLEPLSAGFEVKFSETTYVWRFSSLGGKKEILMIRC